MGTNATSSCLSFIVMSSKSYFAKLHSSLTFRIKKLWNVLKICKSKGKSYPITDHEGPQGDYRYSSALSLNSALEAGGWSRPRPLRRNICDLFNRSSYITKFLHLFFKLTPHTSCQVIPLCLQNRLAFLKIKLLLLTKYVCYLRYTRFHIRPAVSSNYHTIK
jgi:hypothetical protein